MKKKAVGIISIATMAVLLGACGTKEKQEPTKASSSTEVSSTVESSTETSESTKTADKAASGTVDFSGLVTYIKEETDSEEAKVLNSGSEAFVSQQGPINVTLDGYELIEITDFHADYEIPFGRQTERGGVLMTKYTIKNEGDDTVYYPLIPEFTYTGATKAYSSTKSLLPEKDDEYTYIMSTILGAKSELKAGESFEGYSAVAIDPEALDAIEAQGFITMKVNRGYKVADSFKTDDAIGKEESINLPLSSDGAEEVAAAGAFFQDKATTENMGKKTLISEKKELKETQTLSDIEAVLTGYQFTEFEPNEVEAPRFENFDSGVILLTVAFDIANKSDQVVSLYGASSVLKVNDKKQSVLSEGMLMKYAMSDVVKKGETKELLQVYVMNKEEYEKIWQDKAFGIELKLYDEDSKELAKGKRWTFDLPTK